MKQIIQLDALIYVGLHISIGTLEALSGPNFKTVIIFTLPALQLFFSSYSGDFTVNHNRSIT